ncbi:hypothetical protein [uncultured Rubinisphaera sp.]|uniref:hypothetical protein n=1 Tax=uncultured Rubinisphaera sp. TaxID=1678686 RepID=UPI0030DA174D
MDVKEAMKQIQSIFPSSSSNVDITLGPKLKEDQVLESILKEYFDSHEILKINYSDYLDFIYYYSYFYGHRKGRSSGYYTEMTIFSVDPRPYGSSAIEDNESVIDGFYLFARALICEQGASEQIEAEEQPPRLYTEIDFGMCMQEDCDSGIYYYVFDEKTKEDIPLPFRYFCKSFSEWIKIFVETAGNFNLAGSTG